MEIKGGIYLNNLSKFTKFLVKAKQNTYALGGKKEKSSNRKA
jgi:hypothetical protein